MGIRRSFPEGERSQHIFSLSSRSTDASLNSPRSLCDDDDDDDDEDESQYYENIMSSCEGTSIILS